MNRKSEGGIFQPMTLDVDDKILDRNLKFVADSTEDDLNSLFPGFGSSSGRIANKSSERFSLLPEQEYASVQVTPEPGLCIKTKNIQNEKVFINLCKIQEIPPAPPLSEEKLQEIIISEDYTAEYKVPMSLGAPRKEIDKSGQTCYACDVAVNSIWFTDTMVKSLTFTTFVVNLAMEGLCDKYGDVVNLDRQNWTILKNKKYLGTLQTHHIQQRPGLTKIQEIKSELEPLIQEIGSKVEDARKRPEFTLTKETRNNFLLGKFMLPGVMSGRELSLDIGEDRIIIQSKSGNFFLDIFLPLNLEGSKCVAQFNKKDQVLNVQVPVISG